MEQQGAKKDNSGYLFPNNNKKSEKQPDFRGKITINGKEMLISGWKKGNEGMITVAITDPDTLPARPADGKSSQGGFSPSAAPSQGNTGSGSSFKGTPNTPAPSPAQDKAPDGYDDELDDLFKDFEG